MKGERVEPSAPEIRDQASLGSCPCGAPPLDLGEDGLARGGRVWRRRRSDKKGKYGMTDKSVCELPKNARETIRFRLGEFKGHRFIDMRIFALEDGKDSLPTKKGLALSPNLWPQFRAALAQVEAELVAQGWLDREDLEAV